MLSPPSLAAIFTLSLSAAAAGAADWWLEPQPRDDAERALAAVVAPGSERDAGTAAAALIAFAEARSGTPEAGLARYAAARRLAETRATLPQVEAQLRHADVAASGVGAWAAWRLGAALEAQEQHAAAAAAWLEALQRRDAAPFACRLLADSAQALSAAQQDAAAAAAWGRSLDRCPGDRPAALLFLAGHEEAAGRSARAAELYDRLDRDHPASLEARTGAPRLAALASLLPPLPEDARARRALDAALALLRAGRDAEAAERLQRLLASPALADSADRIRLRLAEAESNRGRFESARSALGAIPAGSPHAGEAAFELARLAARSGPAVPAYEGVAERFRGTRWAQEALFALGNHFQRDALDERALPFYRRLYDEYPNGEFRERVTWRVGWGAIRAGRYEEAARVFEVTARERPASSTAGIFLYWAGRARQLLGQLPQARGLLGEASRRFKHTYHGQLAEQALAALPGVDPQPPPALAAVTPAALQLDPASLDRLHRLVLIGHFDEAADELRADSLGRGADATLAWLESRAGRPAAALRAIARAYPQHESGVGDSLPEPVWRLLYPLPHAEALRAEAAADGVEPALVAALIRQESEFDAAAVSGAGARGLMQIMPATGRQLARELGRSFSNAQLLEAETSLRLGTRYLRQMLDRFDGRVERALAAYNAGPHRVDAWEALHPGLDQEAFVENIPFTQTRLYVRKVLANRHHYRRLYPTAAATGGAEEGP